MKETGQKISVILITKHWLPCVFPSGWKAVCLCRCVCVSVLFSLSFPFLLFCISWAVCLRARLSRQLKSKVGRDKENTFLVDGWVDGWIYYDWLFIRQFNSFIYTTAHSVTHRATCKVCLCVCAYLWTLVVHGLVWVLEINNITHTSTLLLWYMGWYDF